MTFSLDQSERQDDPINHYQTEEQGKNNLEQGLNAPVRTYFEVLNRGKCLKAYPGHNVLKTFPQSTRDIDA